MPHVGDTLAELPLPHHQPDHRRRAADLSADVYERPASCPKPEGELLLFVGEVASHHGSPVIERRDISQDLCAHRLDPPILKRAVAFFAREIR